MLPTAKHIIGKVRGYNTDRKICTCLNCFLTTDYHRISLQSAVHIRNFYNDLLRGGQTNYRISFLRLLQTQLDTAKQPTNAHKSIKIVGSVTTNDPTTNDPTTNDPTTNDPTTNER